MQEQRQEGVVSEPWLACRPIMTHQSSAAACMEAEQRHKWAATTMQTGSQQAPTCVLDEAAPGMAVAQHASQGASVCGKGSRQGSGGCFRTQASRVALSGHGRPNLLRQPWALLEATQGTAGWTRLLPPSHPAPLP